LKVRNNQIKTFLINCGCKTKWVSWCYGFKRKMVQRLYSRRKRRL